jgi:hypothetical protein
MRLAEYLQEESLDFARLSKPAQRVAIARDVLKLVRGGFAKPTHSIYMDKHTIEAGPENVRVRPCQACALGCMFLAVALKRPGLLLMVGRPNLELRRYFTERQLAAIEEAFEEDFRKDSRRILREIMNNIIKNKGTFVPCD